MVITLVLVPKTAHEDRFLTLGQLVRNYLVNHNRRKQPSNMHQPAPRAGKERGKRHASKSRLVLVLLLIG